MAAVFQFLNIGRVCLCEIDSAVGENVVSASIFE